MPLNIDDIGSRYPEHYKNQAKIIWYKAGRPRPQGLYEILPIEPISGMKPKVTTLREWAYKDWKEWADEMDELVMQEIQGRTIEEKVKMFERFTETAQEMQNLALEWLRENKTKINAIAAVRLLVDGVRIESEARGVPEVLRRMVKMTNDELLDEVKQLLAKTPVAMETIEEVTGEKEDYMEDQNGDL